MMGFQRGGGLRGGGGGNPSLADRMKGMVQQQGGLARQASPFRGRDPRAMPPQATTQPVGAPNVQTFNGPGSPGRPQMQPMQRQMMQAQQLRRGGGRGMRRPPNPTGNRRPMGGRRGAYR